MNRSTKNLLYLPDWLAADENYHPIPDRDTFINKSILSLLKIISKIRMQDSRQAGKFEVNAAFKVAFTLMLVLLLSLSGSFTFVIIALVYLLASLSLMRARDIVNILKVAFGMTLFSFVVLLPAAFEGNIYSCIMITSKVFATVTSINMLSYSTKWNAITSALKRFFIPDIFIFVLDITIKYIVMLGDFTLNMLYSLKLRSVGKNRSKYTSLSGIAGTLFIKSREMSEEMYSAMECRGFTGEYKNHSRFVFSPADLAYTMINAGIVAAFIYSGGFR